jgi:hypothetical protein
MGQTKRLLENLEEQQDEIDRLWGTIHEEIAIVEASDPVFAREVLLHLEDLIADLHALYWLVWKKRKPGIANDASPILEKTAVLARGILNDPWTKWIVPRE